MLQCRDLGPKPHCDGSEPATAQALPAAMAREQNTVKCPKCRTPYPASAATDNGQIKCAQCGTAFALGDEESRGERKPRATLVGKTLGGYKILAQIAKGGMGSVYKAKQLALGRVVALKRLSTRLAGEQFLQRFLNEARAAAKLSHPNIVQVYDIKQEYGFHFIAMEYVEGPTLRERIESGGAIRPLRAVEIGVDVAKALTCARESSIVHRDIKPDNVLLGETGQVKVADFGLAKLVDEAMVEDGGYTQEGLGLGTPHYMAPEQASNAKAADQRADVYSLGVTMYHMLTGQPPFRAKSPLQIVRMHESETPAPPSEYNPDVPVSLCEVLSKMMAKAPDDRYQEPREVAEALEEVAKEMRWAEQEAKEAAQG